MQIGRVFILGALLLAGCATPTSRPIADIREESLKDHALLFGSIWSDKNPVHGRTYFGKAADGTALLIRGDEATKLAGPGDVGDIRLFAQLVRPGDYRFSPWGTSTAVGRHIESADIETFEAGQIVYMGQLVCMHVWFSCVWITIDQLGRDLYHASEANPHLPWKRTVFRDTDLSTTALDFRSQRVRLIPEGPAVHRGSEILFPVRHGAFERQYVETYGGLNAGAVYRNIELGVEAQALAYRMNVFPDETSENGLSDRLREVVLDREANVALLAYLNDVAPHKDSNPKQAPVLNSELAILMRPDGLRAGRRIDAIANDGNEYQRVRFYVFSEKGWLIRYRFAWNEAGVAARQGGATDASPAREAAFKEFMLAQQWPATDEGDAK